MTVKILVTGGAGFLGSHLCRRLLSENHEVLCLDNLFTGSMKNIKDLLTNRRFTFINHDVIEPFDYEVDEIYNLACPASPKYYQLQPTKTIKTSFLGAVNALDVAVKYNARILQSSTSEIYGDPLEHPQSESYRGNVNTIGPRACYDEGKRAAESLFFDYHREFGAKIKVIRIFNVYGPNMSIGDGRVVSNFIIAALKNEPLTIYGSGLQTRSFCYVSDLVDGMIKMMGSRTDFLGPVNIGNPIELSVTAIAEKIIAMTGSASILEYHPLPEDDPYRRKPMIDLAKAELDWQPRVNLEEGLAATIAYFKGII